MFFFSLSFFSLLMFFFSLGSCPPPQRRFLRNHHPKGPFLSFFLLSFFFFFFSPNNLSIYNTIIFQTQEWAPHPYYLPNFQNALAFSVPHITNLACSFLSSFLKALGGEDEGLYIYLSTIISFSLFLISYLYIP